MPDKRGAAIQYAQENNQEFLKQLVEFSSIASISTDPQHVKDVEECAQWVAVQLKRLGMDNVRIHPTNGHPVVFGELKSNNPDAATVLVYGHYDVQPVEPLELWTSGPFKPVRDGENLVARGASDMKGQVLASIFAIESIISRGEIPVNVKFLIEGEEEIGSPNLADFISAHRDILHSDFALNPDTGMLGPDFPTITYALRGLAYFEVTVYGPDHDLHSGLFGGVVHNPAQALCELIAGMHDSDHKVTLPGFYDKVINVEQEEREQLERLSLDEVFYLENTGAPKLWGEQGYTPVERIGFRPTLEVNGIYSGFTEEGTKTVIPAWAMAKISSRLVPNQDPEEVHQQLIRYLEEHAPKTIRFEVMQLAKASPAISDRESVAVKAMQDAMKHVWGVEPLFRREGGTVPVIGLFRDILGIESVNCGFSLPDDNAHSPNEKLHLPTWSKGIDSLIHFIFNFAAEGRQ